MSLQLIVVGTRHCRVLHLYHSDANGIDIIPILDFDGEAVPEFQSLRNLYPRLGAMDLKIASVALVNQAVVLTRNSRDFGQIAGLFIEDWT